MNVRTAPKVTIVRFAPWMTFQNSHPHDLMWPCAVLYAAGIARNKGWNVDVCDLHVEPLKRDEIVDRITSTNPDLVLLDTMTPTAGLAWEVAALVAERRPNLQIVGVGQHASEATDHLLRDGTAYTGVLRGEYEEAFGELLDGASLASIDGSVVRGPDGLITHGNRREISDVDGLPPLDPRGIPTDRYRMRSVSVPQMGRVRWGNLLTSRGCPYPCTFCSPTLRQSYGRGYRAHSAERVVDDMARLHTDHGITAWYMIDDVFSLNKQRVIDICDGLAKKKLPMHWTIQTRADLLDKDVCDALVRGGCTAVKMGIESGVPRILKQIRKNETAPEMLDAARMIRKSGLQLTAYYMLGHPTETLDDIAETMRYARDIDADMIQVAFHTPYPGSKTWDTYRERITDLNELNHYETQHLNASEVSSEELERLQREFYLKYYFSPRIFTRYLKNRLLYRATDLGEWELAFGSLKYLLGARGLADKTKDKAHA